jgi:hydrogenase maturation protease
MPNASTLVLGLGNSILKDDAVGLVIAEALRDRLQQDETVEVLTAECGGLRLLEVIRGYDRVILIDAMKSADGVPGTLSRHKPSDLKPTHRLTGSHEVSFAHALELGRLVGMGLPREVTVYAIEVDDPFLIEEGLTPGIAQRVPEFVDRILREQFPPRTDVQI